MVSRFSNNAVYLPTLFPGGHIEGARSLMNVSMVITLWYFFSGSTLK